MIEDRLRSLGIDLPQPSLPGANYVPYHIEGTLLFITGQLSQWNGERRYIGKLGDPFTLVEAQHAARLAALNVLAQAKANSNVARHLEGKTIIKEIVVPGRLVNFVAK